MRLYGLLNPCPLYWQTLTPYLGESLGSYEKGYLAILSCLKASWPCRPPWTSGPDRWASNPEVLH